MANLEILMITRNRLEYLKKALPSVLNQTYKDLKLVIWDNGSDEGIVRYLGTIDDPRVDIIINGKNEGLANVTTKVFLSSRCEFVGKVDSDMIITPDWAERLIAKHQERHYGFIGGFHFKPEDLINIEPITENDVWQKHHIGGNYIIRRDDFKGYRGEGVHGLSEYQAEMGLINGYLWNPILWVEHMEDYRSKYYIDTKEYNQYKLETRGMNLADYRSFTNHKLYLKENTK
mgnify:CR=1 FL=1